MNKEIPSVEQIADVFKKIMNKKMICGQSIRNNWEDRETETIDWIELLPVVELVEQYHSEENQAITQHTADLQRQLDERDKNIESLGVEMIRRDLKAHEKLTEAQSQIVALGERANTAYLDATTRPENAQDAKNLLKGIAENLGQALTSTTEAGERIKREWLDKQLSKLHHEIWLELHHSVHPDDSKYRQGITVCLNILIEQRKALQALKEGGV